MKRIIIILFFVFGQQIYSQENIKYKLLCTFNTDDQNISVFKTHDYNLFYTAVSIKTNQVFAHIKQISLEPSINIAEIFLPVELRQSLFMRLTCKDPDLRDTLVVQFKINNRLVTKQLLFMTGGRIKEL